MLHLASCARPLAHARDPSRSTPAPPRRIRKVKLVVTGAQLAERGLAWMPTLSHDVQAVLATDKVRFQGQEVAFVVAEDRYAARDALELIDVEYEPLPAVVDARTALDAGRAGVRDDLRPADNHFFDWETGDAAATDAVFAARRRRGGQDMVYPRVHPAPLETCGAVADHDPVDRPAHALVHHPGPARAPDAASRGGRHPGAPDPGHLARHRRRLRQQGAHLPRLPVRHRGVVAARPAGQVDGGPVGEPHQHGVRPRLRTCAARSRRPATADPRRCASTCSPTTARSTAPRASQVPGRVLRRLHRQLRHAGRALPRDRRVHEQGPRRRRVRVLVPGDRGVLPGGAAGRLPRRTSSGSTRPSCGCATCCAPSSSRTRAPPAGTTTRATTRATLARRCASPTTTELRREQAERRAPGRADGHRHLRSSPRRSAPGRAAHGHRSGWAWPTAPSCGCTRPARRCSGVVQTQGQGHETTFAQIVARGAGHRRRPTSRSCRATPTDAVRPRHLRQSRSTPVSGAAAVVAARKVRERARLVAAAMLEVAPQDLEWVGAASRCAAYPARARRSGRSPWPRTPTCELPDGVEGHLDATAVYNPPNLTFPCGAYVCVVDVDPGTGQVAVRRFIAVDDCGVRINPMIVEGQIHGGLADGVGMALMELIAFDEDGNYLGASLMDYLLPTALECPMWELGHGHALAAPPGRGQGRGGVRHRRLARRRSSTPCSTPDLRGAARRHAAHPGAGVAGVPGRPMRPDLAIGDEDGENGDEPWAGARGRAADPAHTVRARDRRAGRATDERKPGDCAVVDRRRHARRLRRRRLRGVHRARREPAPAGGGRVRAAADHPGRRGGARTGRRANGGQPVPFRRHAGDLPGGDDPADAGGGVRGVAGGAGARAGGGGARLGRADGRRPPEPRTRRPWSWRRTGAASSPSSARPCRPRWATSRWSRAGGGPQGCSTSSAPPRASAGASTPRRASTSAPGRPRRSRCRCARASSRPGRGSRGCPTRPPRPVPAVAVDPICGMEVLVEDGALQAGDVYFCGPGASPPGGPALRADDRARGAVHRHRWPVRSGAWRPARRPRPGCRTPGPPRRRASWRRPSPSPVRRR